MKQVLALTLALLAPIAPAALAQSADMQALVAEAQGQVGAEIAPGATIAAVNLTPETFDYVFRFDPSKGANIEGAGLFATALSQGLCVQPPVAAFIAGGGVANIVIQDQAGTTVASQAVTSC